MIRVALVLIFGAAVTGLFIRTLEEASAAPSDVLISTLSCDSSPEYVRIRNFGGSTQSLASFRIQSDPSQDYLLADHVASIAAGQTLEFQSGSGSADNPGAGIYKLTGSNIYRNSDPTDYARLVRPATTSHQVNCGDTPTTPTAVPTPSPTGVPTLTASPTATPTAGPTGTATPTPTPTPQATDAVTPGASTTSTPEPTPTSIPTGSSGLIWGDHNCSGSADPVDSLLTLRYDAGLSTNTGDCPNFGEPVSALVAAVFTWGDVDCGGDVTPVDSLKLLRSDAGLSVSQNAGCPTIGAPI